jgi:hypothetical protein
MFESNELEALIIADRIQWILDDTKWIEEN